MADNDTPGDLHIIERLQSGALVEITSDRPTLLRTLDYLDRFGGEEETGVDRFLTRALYLQAQQQRTISAIDEGYIIYRLKQSVEAEVWHQGEQNVMRVPRWTTWDNDLFERYDTDPREGWQYFCIHYLGMEPNTAYQRQKTWDLYYNTLGWTREQMERAGISKLNQARGRVAQDWESGGVDERLSTLLMGETYEEVGEDPPPAQEPTDYVTPPGSHAEVRSHLRERKQNGPAHGERPRFTFATGNGGEESLVTCWITRPGDPVAVAVDLAVLKTLPRPEALTEDEWRAALGQLRGRVGK